MTRKIAQVVRLEGGPGNRWERSIVLADDGTLWERSWEKPRWCRIEWEELPDGPPAGEHGGRDGY